MPSVLITDYGSLKNAIRDWLYRANDNSTLGLGQSMDDQAAQFIQLFEARARRKEEWLIQVYSLALGGGSPLSVTGNPTQLPPMRQMRTMWANTSLYKQVLEVVNAESWADLKQLNLDVSGVPQKAVILYNAGSALTLPATGPQLYLWPNPAGIVGSFAVDFEYLADLIPLSGTSPTNPLLTRHPDFYLYGALLESTTYFKDSEFIPIWQQRFDASVIEINIERERMQFGASAKRPRLPRVF